MSMPIDNSPQDCRMNPALGKIFAAAVIVTFAVYVLILLRLLIFRASFRPNLSFRDYLRYASNFVPFRTIGSYLKYLSLSNSAAIKNLAGNLFIFTPMGFYLPYFIRRMKNLLKFTCFMSFTILTVETAQFLARMGSFDVDDFILNLIGALMGFFIVKYSPIRRILGK